MKARAQIGAAERRAEIKARLMRSSTLAPDSNGGCHVVERIYARGSLGHSGLRCHDVFHDPRRP